jgi:hypothetical protein
MSIDNSIQPSQHNQPIIGPAPSEESSSSSSPAPVQSGDSLGQSEAQNANLKGVSAAHIPMLFPPDQNVSIAEFTAILEKWATESRKVKDEVKAKMIVQGLKLHEQRVFNAKQAIQVSNDVFDVFKGDQRLSAIGNAVSAVATGTWNAAVATFNGVGQMFSQAATAFKDALDAVGQCAKILGEAVLKAAGKVADAGAAAVTTFIKGAGDLANDLFTGKLKLSDIGSRITSIAAASGNAAKAKCDEALETLNQAINRCNEKRNLFVKAQDEFKEAGKTMEAAASKAQSQFGGIGEEIRKRNEEMKAKYGDNLPNLDPFNFKFPDFPTQEFKEIGPALGQIFGDFKVDLGGTKKYDLTPPLVIAGVTVFPAAQVTLPDFKFQVSLPSLDHLKDLGDKIGTSFKALGTFAEKVFSMFGPPWLKYYNGVIAPVMNSLIQVAQDTDLVINALKQFSERSFTGGNQRLSDAEKLGMLAAGLDPEDISKIDDELKKQQKIADEKAAKAEPKSPAEQEKAKRLDKTLGAIVMENILQHVDKETADQAMGHIKILALGLMAEMSPAVIFSSVETMKGINEELAKRHQLPLNADSNMMHTIAGVSQAEMKMGVISAGVPAVAAHDIVVNTPGLAKTSPKEQVDTEKAIQALIEILMSIMSGMEISKVAPGQMKKVMAHSLEGLKAQPGIDAAALRHIYQDVGASNLLPEQNRPLSVASDVAKTHQPYMEQAVVSSLVREGLSEKDALSLGQAVIKHVAANGNTAIDPTTLLLPSNVDPAAILHAASHAVNSVLHATDFKNALISSYKEQRPGIPADQAEGVAEQAVKAVFGLSLAGNPVMPTGHTSITSTMDKAIGQLSESVGVPRLVETMKDFLAGETDVLKFTSKVLERAQTIPTLMNRGMTERSEHETFLLG